MMKQRGYEGRMGSTLLMETPEGIVITGDLCPRTHTRGVISDLNYTLGWFAGTNSAEYQIGIRLTKGVFQGVRYVLPDAIMDQRAYVRWRQTYKTER